MVFSSITFISVFLPVVFVLHWILPGIRAKNICLVAASLLFYAYGEPVFVLWMLASAFVNYLFGLLLGRGKGRRFWLVAAIIWNLGLLAVYKYAGFAVSLLHAAGLKMIPMPAIVMPIGISFFTFQILSYVIDVYRGSVAAQKSFGKVLLYISFFPQLIAGPIVKYHDMELAIDSRKLSLDRAVCGMRRFIAGLCKKVLLANTFALAADTIYGADPGMLNVCSAWIGAISYLLQIYFDFSGYSDMALGMAELFGFQFRENFDYPYVAVSIRDFWRRWHISLSSWFREYLYIPLGGNRKGKLRTVLNKWIVFFCTGLWHGADLTFVFWGLYHGFFLMLEEVVPVKMNRILGHVYTLLVVTVGFVFFRADSMMQGMGMLREMFAGFHFEPGCMRLVLSQLTPVWLAALLAGAIAAAPVWKRLRERKWIDRASWLLSLPGLGMCMLSLASGTYNPFIYFRF